jgi:hypothetical protein
MQPFTVTDRANHATFDNFKVAPNLQLITDLRNLSMVDASERYPAVVEHEHDWYSQEYKQAARERAEMLVLATQMKLVEQVRMNIDALFELLTRDLAERVYRLAVQRLNYQGEITVYQNTFDSDGSFRSQIPIERKVGNDWEFYPIERFPKLIPLQALKAIQTLSKECIVPEKYWVADLLVTPIARRWHTGSLSADPILCAQFGSWFAGIAMWL